MFEFEDKELFFNYSDICRYIRETKSEYSLYKDDYLVAQFSMSVDTECPNLDYLCNKYFKDGKLTEEEREEFYNFFILNNTNNHWRT